MEGWPACDIVVNFFNSDEFAQRGLDTYDTVAVAYRAILEREGSEEEIQWWVDLVDAEGMSVEDLAMSLCDSDEFNDICDYYGLVSGTR